MEQEYVFEAGNMAFLFLPMDLKNIEDYEHFQKQLKESRQWKLVDDRMKKKQKL